MRNDEDGLKTRWLWFWFPLGTKNYFNDLALVRRQARRCVPAFNIQCLENLVWGEWSMVTQKWSIQHNIKIVLFRKSLFSTLIVRFDIWKYYYSDICTRTFVIVNLKSNRHFFIMLRNVMFFIKIQSYSEIYSKCEFCILILCKHFFWEIQWLFW